MGGSESRFMISPFMVEEHKLSFWHSPVSFREGDQILLTQQYEPNDRLSKVLFKKDGEYVNIRFDQHPQPYIAVGIDQHSVICKESHGQDCQWVVLAIAVRQAGTKNWNPIDRSMQLDWDHTKDKEFLIIFVTRSRRVLTVSDAGLAVVNLPPLNADPTHDDELAAIVSRSMFVVQTVGHSWSFDEVARGIVGAMGGVGSVAFTSILAPACALGATYYMSESDYADSKLPRYTRYPLDVCENSMQSPESLLNVGLALQWFISKV